MIALNLTCLKKGMRKQVGKIVHVLYCSNTYVSPWLPMSRQVFIRIIA